MRHPIRHFARSIALPIPRGVVAIVLAALVAFAAAPAAAEHPEISARRAADRKVFTDAQIAAGFFKVAFGAELGFRGDTNRIRKYVKPVRVFVESLAKPDRREAFRKVVADVAMRIPTLDIAVTERRQEANVTVRLVRDRDLEATIRRLYGKRGEKIVKSLEPQCLSGFSRDEQYRIVRSDVILVVDAGEFIFYDCAYEELLQALGPIQDTKDIPWTMFNDDVQKGFFGVYDQYLLNILYHPKVRPGMTPAQVRRILPAIMPEVRAIVARNNKIEARPPPLPKKPRRK
jgi:hypothetical protein